MGIDESLFNRFKEIATRVEHANGVVQNGSENITPDDLQYFLQEMDRIVSNVSKLRNDVLQRVLSHHE